MSDTRSRAGFGVATTELPHLQYGDHVDDRIEYHPTHHRDAAVVAWFDGAGRHPRNDDARTRLADGAAEAGFAFATVRTSPPQRGGLSAMVDQARRAIDRLATHVGVGQDGTRLVVGGHGVGAHLAAMIAVHDPRPCGYVLVSGIYDLAQPGGAAHQRELEVTDDEARLLSPLALIGPSDAACVVAWADGDTPEVRRQGQAWATRWTMSHWNRNAVAVHVRDRSHVDVTDDLFDAHTPLGAAVRSVVEGRPLDAV